MKPWKVPQNLLGSSTVYCNIVLGDFVGTYENGKNDKKQKNLHIKTEKSACMVLKVVDFLLNFTG